MGYNIMVSPRAQKEIENAIEFYALYSADVPKYFITSLQKAYDILESNPFFKIQHKNIRSLKIKNFPYSLYFIIKQEKNSIRVLSCFHHKRNPTKRPQ